MCNGNGFKPYHKPVEMTEGTDGIIYGYHRSCKNGGIDGISVVCGKCCIENNGFPALATKCKCAPKR